jgi:hypothetical protein
MPPTVPSEAEPEIADFLEDLAVASERTVSPEAAPAVWGREKGKRNGEGAL